MRKTIQKFVSLALALTLLSTFGISASAAEYAYSIGHDFGTDVPFVSDYEGDFTENVSYAATIYGMLGYTSFYSYDPDYNYLRGENPDGDDRLGSSVIFLNGHAANDNLLCGDTVDDDEHQCGVHRDTDFKSPSSGYTYAGLESRDLSNVKLMSFVGCNTASTDDNLCTTAVDEGADCAIGFTSNIHSRTNDGKNWLIYYHNALGNGSSVEEAIDVATTSVPDSDLGDYIDTFGNPGINLLLSNTARNNIAKESLTSYERFCNVVTNSKTTDYQIDIDVTDVVDVSGNFDFASVETNRYIDLSEVEEQYQDIISIMVANDPDFDVENYKVLANEYADNTGIVKVRYYIDDIQTSAVTVFKIKDGVVDYVSYANDLTKYDVVDETEILSAKRRYVTGGETEAISANAINGVTEVTIESQRGYYYYNFEEGALYYIVDTVYSLNGFDGAHATYMEKNLVFSILNEN